MNIYHSITGALVCMAVSTFAQEQKCKKSCLLPGEPLDCSYQPSYNAPAAIDVNRICGIDFFTNISFTYWLAQEEGFTLGYITTANADVSPGGPNTTKSKIRFQESDFTPSFKVGLGMVANHEWLLQAEYTWYRSKNTTHGESITEGVPFAQASDGIGTGVWFIRTTLI